MSDTHLILQAIDPIILLLSLGILAVILSKSVGLSPIVGYLLLGLALSRTSHQIFKNGNTIQTLSELGVVFLLFDIGLHFSFARMREQATNIFGFGPLQVLLGAIVIGGGAALFGLGIGASFLVGATLALSSTAVVARLIAERHQQSCPVGVTATAILIFQDVAAIAILIIATAFGTGDAVLPTIGLAFVKALLAFGVAALLARFVVRPVLTLIVRTQNEEVFTALALLIALSAGWATAALGLSMTLGAFLGGTILSDTPYRAVIQSEIKPFRGLLLGFFFVSVGLSIDTDAILSFWPAILCVAALIVAGKVLSNMAASLVFRWSTPGSTQLGFLLSQGSEFAFVIFSIPAVRALLGQDITSVLIAAVALTLAATPSLAEVGRNLAGKMRARARKLTDAELIPLETAVPVLIFGIGVRGRSVADALMEFDIAYLAIESDDRLLREAIADGYDVMLGSFSDPRLWQPMAIEGRMLNVLTEPRLETAAYIMPAVQHQYPDLPLLAAATDGEEAKMFNAIGLQSIKDPRRDGVDLAVQVLIELEVDPASAANWGLKRRGTLEDSQLEAA
jgi:CPA2 family monovalent cation:H+ antiporter-2